MKKYWKLLLMAAGIGIFTACEDVPEPYNIPTEGNTPSLPTADYIINQTFTSSLGDFKSQATSGSLAWTSDTRYGAIISGYQDFDGDGNKENKPGETYLISPEIDLTEADSAYVIIEQAINYAKSTLAEDHHLLIRVGEGDWAELPMNLDGLGTSFTYLTQNIQIPDEFMGKKIQLALKHTAHNDYSSTWEVKSLKVAKGTAPEASVIETPVIEGVGSGTKDDPYDVSTTIKLIAAGPPTYKIYTKGIVCEVNASSFKDQYRSLTYFISNDGTKTDKLEVYNGYGLGGAKFNSAEDLKVGDEVIVYGQVINYNGTPEYTTGSQLYFLNGKTSGGGDTPTEGIEVSCAKAVELTNALADGATSTETYSVTGYITEVIGSVSRNQQTFWMADTKDGGRVFEAYYANLPEGVSAFKAGAKVKITGQLMKYVNATSGQVIPEIKNATVEILEDGGDTPAPAGKEVTCAQAVELTNALDDGATSNETYAVSGYITEVIGSVSRNQQTFWMADTQDGGRVFEAYWANLPAGVSEFKAGMKVKITGKLMKYVKDGNVTPEIKNADVQILEGGEGGGGDTPGGATLADFGNGDFETWEGDIPTGWQTACNAGNATLSQSTDAHSGSYSVIVKGSTSGNKRLAYKELELEAGTYDCSFWTKAATESAASLCPGYAAVGSSITYNYNKGEDGKNKYVNDIAQDWQQVKYSFTLSSKTTVCLIVMNSKTPGKDILIDDFTITKN